MNVLRHLKVGRNTYSYNDLAAAEAGGLADVSRLPCSIKVVLENLLRHGESDDLSAISQWLKNRKAEREISFRFTRVLMPDSSGIPLLGDTAAIESELATFNDREEAVDSKHWRELESKYLKDV